MSVITETQVIISQLFLISFLRGYSQPSSEWEKQKLYFHLQIIHEARRVSGCPKFSREGLQVMEKDRSSLYSENPRAIAVGRGSLRGGGGNVRNHDVVSRSPCEPNSMFWMEIHVPFLFFPISAVVSIQNSEWRGQNSEGINSNHKWRKIGLSDLSPIRPTDEWFLKATALTVYPTMLDSPCSWGGVLPAPAMSSL